MGALASSSGFAYDPHARKHEEVDDPDYQLADEEHQEGGWFRRYDRVRRVSGLHACRECHPRRTRLRLWRLRQDLQAQELPQEPPEVGVRQGAAIQVSVLRVQG